MSCTYCDFGIYARSACLNLAFLCGVCLAFIHVVSAVIWHLYCLLSLGIYNYSISVDFALIPEVYALIDHSVCCDLIYLYLVSEPYSRQKGILKTLLIKEKMLATIIYSFSNKAFYPFSDRSHEHCNFNVASLVYKVSSTGTMQIKDNFCILCVHWLQRQIYL